MRRAILLTALIFTMISFAVVMPLSAQPAQIQKNGENHHFNHCNKCHDNFTCFNDIPVIDDGNITPPDDEIILTQISGGGYIEEENSKNNFAINIINSSKISGNINYLDKNDDYHFHAKIIEWLEVQITENSTTAYIYGTGKIGKIDGYYFIITVTDYGEPGHGVDTFEISIYEPNDGDLFDLSSGVLVGGNINIKII